ncbi:MAG: hypothetical protein RLZZ126_682 [Pseudomonadota bacterium]|jgi:3-deoxy-D-manno-octulosonate 8-phosphate phosphatase (KDO 8-P phosphatase)
MPTLPAPALTFAPELLLRAQMLRAVFLDVDGVMTDGGLYQGEAGEQLKRFHTLDGYGLKLLMQSGIQVVVISGRDSPVLRSRLKELGVQHMSLGTEAKLVAAAGWLQTLGLAWQDIAAMGDDWPDLPVLRRCALACAPANAHPEVLACAHHVTRSAGGHGAVRELCDVLLQAKGVYARLLAHVADGQGAAG